MSERIIAVLKSKLEEIRGQGSLDAETSRNALKEELQFFVLDFIYHHPTYGRWVMYGGSALRIIHGLNRMSVDLDFEISDDVTERLLTELKVALEQHFLKNYGVGPAVLSVKITNGRGVTLKFLVGEALGLGLASNQVHLKIDLNPFVAPGKTVVERVPISHGQFSFVILTYNMANLMASKIAAIFLRGTRGVGSEHFEEKGRDIYDLLWYMERKVVPDFDYLAAKSIDAKQPRALFDKLTLKMNQVSEKNLKQDLEPLFADKTIVGNWLRQWLETYLRLLAAYEISTVKGLEHVEVFQDFSTDVFSFIYRYATEEGRPITIVYRISDYWLEDREGALRIETAAALEGKIAYNSNGMSSRPVPEERIQRYAGLFYRKNESYFQKTGRTMTGARMLTKLIRMTADNLDRREQIVLNMSALLSCELDDLLK